MNRHSVSSFSDDALQSVLAARVAREHTATADVLPCIAEFDARRLHARAGHPSMLEYCVRELGYSEDSARKRIHAARAAREHPAIFDGLASGRLHLSGIVMLAPHLTQENAAELLAAAANKSRSELEQLLAERFPKDDVPTHIRPFFTGSADEQCAPGRVQIETAEDPQRVSQAPRAPGRVHDRSMVTPLSPQAFAVQFTMRPSTHDKLRYAQELLSHRLPNGDVAEVFDRALDALIPQLEKRKFAATSRPRPGHTRSKTRTRHIPARVKRAVWVRDEHQCTFVSEDGRRCEAKTRLEFHHVEEYARGGEASVEGIQLRCRAHNQYEAERTFGVEFMRHKREAARRARVAARASEHAPGHVGAPAPPPLARRPEEHPDERDVIPWLRKLGFSAAEANRGAAHCESIPEASLEARVRHALTVLMPPHRKIDCSPAMTT